MASPALYWTYRIVQLDKSDCLSSAASVMKAKGLTSIKTTSMGVSGRTGTVHAAVGVVKIHDPPSPGPGLGTNAPPTQILFFVAAGADASKVNTDIVAAWDKLKFL
jgi:hypothetical protein